MDATAVNSYKKVASHEAHRGEFATCLLLYSGGLDTSVMLKWIQEEYKCSVIALTLNLGQTADDLTAIREKALMLGAKEAIVVDATDEFADDLLAEAIKANADYQGGYALGCPLGRVMIARIAVRMAAQYNCQVVAHGCTGKGNDQVRFESYITTLNPKLKTIAPVREWGMGRDEEIDYAAKHNIPVKQKKDSPYSYDENMWANTGEGGEIENPELIPPLDRILQWCKTPEAAPETAETLRVDFEKGVPVAIAIESPDAAGAVASASKPLPRQKLSDIIRFANKIGGNHGVGVFQLIEDRVVGLKVRGVYENPAATILISAHRKLEYLVSTREENELKYIMDNKWAYLTYGAKWYDPVMYHIHAYIESQNQKVSGTVFVKLYKGNATVVSLSSPHSLFDHSLATFNKSATFNQNASAGFIEIWNLPQKTAHSVYNYGAAMDAQGNGGAAGHGLAYVSK
ncbi:argininosuccinate synthase [Capsaspora owczarzaki ATCC 30864]|uniref:argininosuccinate synthase n=1 Tax=Capsaspora owczarzaki (strain ATCC 30864) TaxID=595528 RepID=A0A0D2WUY6_CAPO3|nr:argininosuccinate synthase [Capsaspora owczarzaki ATCC 30864]KJE96525.1 argininosuccinate synthase [Capsaspora owczarzaki ATCC 30864]|eukprot:XP_004344455.1 argininosuccinate synthase [Capsaspora owczarzaki ATCC 30864]